MTRPEVARVRLELGIVSLREDEPRPLSDVLERLRGYAGELFDKHGSDPEYDVAPMLHAEGRDGTAVVVAQGGMDDDDEKAAVVAAWCQVLSQVTGRSWGMLSTAWGLEAAEDTESHDPMPVMDRNDPRFLRPTDHPDRVEWCIVQGSDLQRYELWRADVVRDEKGVRLGPWAEIVAVPLAESAGGAMVDPFVDTIAVSALAEAFRLELGDKPDEWWTDERLAAVRRFLDRPTDLFQADPLEGHLAEAVADIMTLGLIVEKDGGLAPSEEILERAGLKPKDAT